MADAASSPNPHAERRHWMAVLARASGEQIAACLAACAPLPAYTRLRGPEAGLVMVRGRVGGGGGAFNLGEMTVTRCTVRTESGLIGHAYVAGRDGRQAELAALVDAMLQDPDAAPSLQTDVIEALASAQHKRRNDIEAKAAATQVQFFAMQNMRT
jgi:alpha-D-ribose 1-methylphosphonate 5-triphosphate synthase subunit PhnG